MATTLEFICLNLLMKMFEPYYFRGHLDLPISKHDIKQHLYFILKGPIYTYR